MTRKDAERGRCPGCGAGFECGMLAGRERWWCEGLPSLPDPVAGSPCYCPRCLGLKVRSAPGPRSAPAP
ncbi:MAG TPA: cysteine-rich CWC family protein [Burkholderiales bacterium]|nr:cysteine-rich CWC family protein [Burkholderiales bacterium]